VADVHDETVDDDRVMDTTLDSGSESVMAGTVDDIDDPPVDHLAERTNLALPLSSFVGRTAEVASLAVELRAQRLVTITGSAGCGKTRLAYEVAWAALPGSPGGVWCVELAPVGDAERAAAELAQVLGVREEFGRPIVDTLAGRLRGFDGLVVLDNCEHVLGGVRPLVDQLLRRCPTLHVLTTSREPLGLTGETTWRVPSLDCDAGVELFVQRAHSARPDFHPSDDELAAIARIVDRLDGIPLAVELAAARVRMMSPTGIESALADRFRLLTGGSRTSLARQQTLEASVAWSYDLLDPDEQAVARRLAVMSDFTLDVAEAVAADDASDHDGAVLELLTHLVDKSIVRVDHTTEVARYRFLESIRQFLHGRLVETGEVERVRARHLAYFLSLVESVEPAIAFADSARLLAMLELEHDNLEAALDFADATGRHEDALRLAASMTLFWELRGHLGRGSRWLARLLDETDDEPSVWRGRACWGAAHIGLYGGDVETMSARAPEALDLAERFDDDWTRARALNTIGFATAIMDPAQARPGLERSVELGMRIGDDWAVLNSSKMMTAAGWAAQDEALVMTDLQVLRDRAAPLGATYFLAWYHGLLGYFLTRRGELASARRDLDVAIEMCDQIGEPVTGSMSEAWRWAIDVMEGEYDEAGRQSAALLEQASASGGGLAIADLLANLGRIAIAQGDAVAAIELLAPAYEAQREHGIPFLLTTMGVPLATALQVAGDLDRAGALLDDLAELAGGLGNEWVGALVDLQRSCVALDRDDVEEAESRAHSALVAFVRLGRRPDIVAAIEQLGCVAASLDSGAEALRCFGAAEVARAEIGLATPAPVANTIARWRMVLVESLGAEAVDECWAEGVALGLDGAVEYVSRARGERKRPSAGWASLTPTERRVAGLVAEGLTNPQIAEQMFIARGTVKVHVSHIFAKVGLSNRAELAALATRRAAGADR
jgi:predicted ATPase/DNA-binding CsgD family transcriptional regulator